MTERLPALELFTIQFFFIQRVALGTLIKYIQLAMRTPQKLTTFIGILTASCTAKVIALHLVVFVNRKVDHLIAEKLTFCTFKPKV